MRRKRDRMLEVDRDGRREEGGGECLEYEPGLKASRAARRLTDEREECDWT